MNDIEQIITDEKYNLEFKEQVNFDEPKKYLKVVSSFANGFDIGYIIFGVEDETKKIIGVKDIKKPKIELLEDLFCVTFYSRLYIEKTSEKHPENIQKTSEKNSRISFKLH